LIGKIKNQLLRSKKDAILEHPGLVKLSKGGEQGDLSNETGLGLTWKGGREGEFTSRSLKSLADRER